MHERRGLAELIGKRSYAALVIQQPNFFGNLEDVDALTDWAHANRMLVIAVVNPISLALYKPPRLGERGKRGADIVCARDSPRRASRLRRPLLRLHGDAPVARAADAGRIVGRTVDTQGRPGFTLTLQARTTHPAQQGHLQHLHQPGLLVTAATIYLSLLGPEGWSAWRRHAPNAPSAWFRR